MDGTATPIALSTYTMGPRLNLDLPEHHPTQRSLWRRIVQRSDDCSPNDPCGRGLSANATTLAIALGVVYVALLCRHPPNFANMETVFPLL